MGVCCGRTFEDEEIENAESLQDLILIFNERRAKFPQERIQIQSHLEDPSNKIEFIGTDNLDNETLQKRILYLNDLEGAYLKVTETLQENPNLPLKETKKYLMNIATKYYLAYDPDKDLDIEMTQFDKFIEKHETTNK
jgi:hypothetical protein